LETGLIDPRGVADTVRDALGALLGDIADTLEAMREENAPQRVLDFLGRVAG
jgi:hypothetical protein